VDRIEYIQIGDDSARDGGTRVGAFDLLVRWRRRAGFHDDRPGELVRSENELIGSRGRRIGGRLGKGMCRDRRMGRTIQNSSG